MAKSFLNVVMQGASGKIGKTLVFRQMRSGETVIANRPKPSDLPLTPGKQAFREKFLNATYLAKKVLHDPMFGPQYLAKKRPGQGAYTVAMKDCLTPPKIMGIFLEGYNGAVGDIISIRATDDFMVTTVKLRILKADDTLIEQGTASLDEFGIDWIYVATVANNPLAGTKVEVTARDIPGNETVEVATII